METLPPNEHNKNHSKSKLPVKFLVVSISFVALVFYIGFKFASENQTAVPNEEHRTKLPLAPTEDVYDVSQLELDMAASKAKREQDALQREIDLKEKMEKERELEEIRADSIKKAVRDSIRKAKSKPIVPNDSTTN